MSGGTFTITYTFADGSSYQALPCSVAPDIERMHIPADVVAMTILAPYQMEHGMDNAEPRDPGDQFKSVYFIDADVISFVEAMQQIEPAQRAALYKVAEAAVSYGCRYAGRPLNTEPEDMRFITLPRLSETYCFQDNYAVLQSLPPSHPTGLQRRRIDKMTALVQS